MSEWKIRWIADDRFKYEPWWLVVGWDCCVLGVVIAALWTLVDLLLRVIP